MVDETPEQRAARLAGEEQGTRAEQLVTTNFVQTVPGPSLGGARKAVSKETEIERTTR